MKTSNPQIPAPHSSSAPAAWPAAVYASLAARWPAVPWIRSVCELAQDRLASHRHGDLPRWRAALERLPEAGVTADLERAAPRLGEAVRPPGPVKESLMALHPWRKGPLELGGQYIDSEWRSDLKWARVAPHVDLAGERVLDVGCGNGYFGLRMLGAGASLVLGIDPTLLYVMQWLACRHFGGDLASYVLPLGIEELPEGSPGFDTVFSMGVLYHRRDPCRHLRRLRALVRPGGRLVLETLVLPAHRPQDLLEPEARYARMRNVWAVPGSERLRGWLLESGWQEIVPLDCSPTTSAEQRSTEWMRFESLAEALDPADPGRTIEGHPAPIRALLVARA